MVYLLGSCVEARHLRFGMVLLELDGICVVWFVGQSVLFTSLTVLQRIILGVLGVFLEVLAVLSS
jgi:hypothetical protein